ncbi:hypothetical protein GOP47_0012658 [Adiantum capillus-veneris]|uniref:ABC1 atypical kinase-like domain-containing protein n=1 Tax=Adiantum capillus-veneris TaxID=13818 RepID=A0A9D4US69_ADICA|nr:hypothetical protein GOP47_0012658 [Adiantum capillus-veneris]
MGSRGREEQEGSWRRKYRRPLLSAAALQLPQLSSTHDNKNRSRIAQPLVRRRVHISAFLGGLAVAAVKLATVLASKVFCGRSWPFIQTASLSSFFIGKHCSDVKISKAASIILEPLYWLSGPVLWTTLSQHILSWCWPDAYRTLRFWRRLLPIYTRYITTKWQVRNKNHAERERVWAQTHEWGGKKVYELILDMSGFYVKSAQILASKAEFVPGAWTRHLSKLLDSAPPRPFHEVKHTIQQQLRECSWGTSMNKCKVAPPLEAVFLDLDKVPLAAASIAQVHGGTLRDGTQIVVKVQHRGMETMMQSDLRNIVWLAKFLQGQLPVDLYPIVKEIQNTIPLEFNFEREVRFMDAIKESMEANQLNQIVCPSPHAEFCTKKLIVMQRIYGVPFTQILHPSKGDSHPRLGEALQAVRHLLEAYGQMIFLDGVFHADPHAGNLFLLPDGRLGLLDYGQSKEIDRGLRRKLAQMVLALCDGNSLSIALALLDIGMVFEPADAVNVPLDRVATAARILFDVCYVEEATVSPMSQNSILKEIPLKKFNQEVWMVIRTNLLLRGLCFALKLNISAARIWQPYAMTALQGS